MNNTETDTNEDPSEPRRGRIANAIWEDFERLRIQSDPKALSPPYIAAALVLIAAEIAKLRCVLEDLDP